MPPSTREEEPQPGVRRVPPVLQAGRRGRCRSKLPQVCRMSSSQSSMNSRKSAVSAAWVSCMGLSGIGVSGIGVSGIKAGGQGEFLE